MGHACSFVVCFLLVSVVAQAPQTLSNGGGGGSPFGQEKGPFTKIEFRTGQAVDKITFSPGGSHGGMQGTAKPPLDLRKRFITRVELWEGPVMSVVMLLGIQFYLSDGTNRMVGNAGPAKDRKDTGKNKVITGFSGRSLQYLNQLVVHYHAAVCGDGYISTVIGEVCDDGNLDDYDGCSATCKIEPNYTCTTPENPIKPSVCSIDHFLVDQNYPTLTSLSGSSIKDEVGCKLESPNPVWCPATNVLAAPNRSGEWLEWSLPQPSEIGCVETTGRPGTQEYITEFELDGWNEDTQGWELIGKFPGNVDDSSSKTSCFPNKMMLTSKVRLHPISWNKWPSTSLRFYRLGPVIQFTPLCHNKQVLPYWQPAPNLVIDTSNKPVSGITPGQPQPTQCAQPDASAFIGGGTSTLFNYVPAPTVHKTFALSTYYFDTTLNPAYGLVFGVGSINDTKNAFEFTIAIGVDGTATVYSTYSKLTGKWTNTTVVRRAEWVKFQFYVNEADSTVTYLVNDTIVATESMTVQLHHIIVHESTLSTNPPSTPPPATRGHWTSIQLCTTHINPCYIPPTPPGTPPSPPTAGSSPTATSSPTVVSSPAVVSAPTVVSPPTAISAPTSVSAPTATASPTATTVPSQNISVPYSYPPPWRAHTSRAYALAATALASLAVAPSSVSGAAQSLALFDACGKAAKDKLLIPLRLLKLEHTYANSWVSVLIIVVSFMLLHAALTFGLYTMKKRQGEEWNALGIARFPNLFILLWENVAPGLALCSWGMLVVYRDAMFPVIGGISLFLIYFIGVMLMVHTTKAVWNEQLITRTYTTTPEGVDLTDYDLVDAPKVAPQFLLPKFYWYGGENNPLSHKQYGFYAVSASPRFLRWNFGIVSTLLICTQTLLPVLEGLSCKSKTSILMAVAIFRTLLILLWWPFACVAQNVLALALQVAVTAVAVLTFMQHVNPNLSDQLINIPMFISMGLGVVSLLHSVFIAIVRSRRTRWLRRYDQDHPLDDVDEEWSWDSEYYNDSVY